MQGLEFKFGDARLNRRGNEFLGAIQNSPSFSFPKIFSHYADLESFYRFMSNERVTAVGIFESVSIATEQGLQSNHFQEEDLIVIHDTTSVSPSMKKVKGLNPIQGEWNEAFLAHLSLVARRSTREVIGPLGLRMWTRDGLGQDRNSKVKRKAKESARWPDQILEAEAKLNAVGKSAVHITDREGDAYELFCDLQKQGARFVIRMRQDRRLIGDQGTLLENLRNEQSQEWKTLKISIRQGSHFAVTRKAHPPREAREVELAVSAKEVELTRTAYSSKERSRYFKGHLLGGGGRSSLDQVHDKST